MNERYMEQNASPNFQESPERVRNNDNSAKNRYRFVKRVRHGHVSLPSTVHFIALNQLNNTGNVTTNCEISGKWQT